MASHDILPPEFKVKPDLANDWSPLGSLWEFLGYASELVQPLERIGWGMDLNHRPLGYEPISGTVQGYSTQSMTSLTNDLRNPGSR